MEATTAGYGWFRETMLFFVPESDTYLESIFPGMPIGGISWPAEGLPVTPSVVAPMAGIALLSILVPGLWDKIIRS